MAATAPKPCKGCDAPITWGVNQHGRGVPLNPDPDPEGDQIVDGQQEDGRLIVHKVRKDEQVPAGTVRYRTHFATCEKADEFRRTDS